MSEPLAVGMSSWIIQDGNYGDFKQGDHAAFALEFGGAALRVADTPPIEPSLRRIRDAEYEAVGQVVHVTDDWWVLDAGVLMYQAQKPPAVAIRGAWLAGIIEIGIDPFSYYERLAHEPDAPPLIYNWMIESIEIQTAPLIDVAPNRSGRDPERLGWRDLSETNAGNDDDGHAEYLLHCHRVDTPPRRSLT